MAIRRKDYEKNPTILPNPNQLKTTEEKPTVEKNEGVDSFEFKPSRNVEVAQSKVSGTMSAYNDHIKTKAITRQTSAELNSEYKKSRAVREADAWLSDQLKLIQSGKTSYSDQVRDMMDKIMNRDKFSYDVDEDPLFQQALASAMKSGQQAMTDTIGQASALTGGYGSTYATTAGNQAYNAYVEDAYDNLPQYYQMARDAYDKEGEEMYRQFGMVSELDDKEYSRNLAAYDATYQQRNALYNEEYGRYRDEKSDAFIMADLEMQAHSTKTNDLYNAYVMDSDYADKKYVREYQQWSDKVNMALQQYAEEMEQKRWEYDYGLDVEKHNLDVEKFAHQKAVDADASARGWANIQIARDKAEKEGQDDGLTEGQLYVASKSKAVGDFKAAIMTEREVSRLGNFEYSQVGGYEKYIDDTIGKWYEEGKLNQAQAMWLNLYYFSSKDAQELAKKWNEEE